MPKKGRGNGPGGKPKPNTLKPRAKLPTSLLPLPSNSPIPSAILKHLEEFRNAQPFFSALERLAPEVATHSRMHSCWLGISGELIADVQREEDSFQGTLVWTDGTTTPLFVKRIHILNPLECMEGECIWPTEGSLPAPSELWLTSLEKLNHPMNEAYIDAIFATVADRLVTTGTSPHWLRCFGTFPARVNHYMFNISEEYSSLRRKSYWSKNQSLGLFQLRKEAAQDDTRKSRPPLQAVFSEDLAMDETDFEVAEVPNSPETRETRSSSHSIEIESEEILQINPPTVRIKRLDDSDSSSEEDFMDYFAEFTDFPVQVTLLERAEGSLDDLLDAEEPLTAETEAKWTAWVFQIIAALNVAQHWFGFVHNDLHTNNIMWIQTEDEYVYYEIHGKTKKVYRVPTYGYIMKIIDFGRASYHLADGFYISDAFFPGNDAANQYNCDPFFDSRCGKRVEPNPSFDLSRLAVSMLDALYPTRPANATPIKIMSREGNKTYAETVSPLYNLLWQWLTDDDGKNILRTPTGEERYPDFDLYSAIAADVHKAIPWQQMEKPLFAYEVSAAPEGEKTYSLWTY